jgi:large subunit ribosomal protein L5
MNRKLQLYRETVVPALMEKYGKKNAFAVAKLEKIVVNVGIGSDPSGEKAVDAVVEQIGAITGQKPRTTKARLSIATFKLRQGQIIGVSVTLRGERMWSFFDKVVSLVLPQLKDFSGVPRDSFDQSGNYNLGLKEQIVFPEIDYDAIDRIRGMQLTFTVANAASKAESFELLEKLGMPFAKEA